jgi:Cu(I)/Ag(I) efflux system membrane fusion protein
MSEKLPRSRWDKFKLVFKVIEIRLRFILILAATGGFIAYWDTIKNHWDKWTRPAATAQRELPADKEFYCPMDPGVVRSSYEPDGSVPKCPICGMPLSQRSKGQSEPLPAGVTARVQLSPERIQMAGVQTVAVAYRPMSKQITTVGTVTYDESRLSRIVSRVSGYVEKLYVNKTFMRVAKGDPLAEIYSPDLYSTAEELLLASKGATASDLAAAARRRLKLLGVGDKEIDAIVAAGAATPRLVIRAPQSGQVIRKNIVEGTRVEDGMTLFEVADLSSVWIEADVFEKDIAFLREGQAVEADVSALAGRVFRAKVASVYPQLDSATRTNRVRFQVANPEFELRPGMFATVRIKTPLGQIEPFRSLLARQDHAAAALLRHLKTKPDEPEIDELLAVPERAVVDTGTKQIVYVERRPGRFEGVEVVLGPQTDDYYPVVKGLAEGDRVAAAGAFLIDAETRLNPAAAAGYFGASGGPSTGMPAGAGAETAVAAPEAAAAKPAAKPAQQFRLPEGEALENVQQLPPADRALAMAQGMCPITGVPLGTMGVPVKVMIRGQPVLLCCQGCVAAATNRPDETLATVARFKEGLQKKAGKVIDEEGLQKKAEKHD